MLIHHLPDGDTVHHYKKSVVIIFAGKRHVISTGPNNGGYREDLQAVFNRDDNPGPGMACVMKDDTYEGHMNLVALEELGLDPGKCTGLCTAASMKNASIQRLSYRGLTVTAIVTAGVEHNGGRAGDPATFYEENGRFFMLSESGGNDAPGTINTILHINADLDPGTLARTIMTATEAKTAVLQELMARSHNSGGLATGSGTDGIISICNPDSPIKLTNAGKNSKLGELIGKTVMAATKDALFRQSGLCPERQRDALRIMGRFGVDEDILWIRYRGFVGTCGKEADKLTKADFIDRLDRWKITSEAIEITFLYAQIMDLLSWCLITEGEAEEMITRMTGMEEADKITMKQTGIEETDVMPAGLTNPEESEQKSKEIIIRWILMKMWVEEGVRPREVTNETAIWNNFRR